MALFLENGTISYNGLDRIDSSKGYTIDNVVPCNHKINMAKNDDTTEDFLAWVKQIAVFQGWIK